MSARNLSALRRKQNGMALMMVVFVLALAGVAEFLSYLDGNGVKIERDKKTAAALAEAKEALIGWSVGHATMPGALPCPDIANTGISGSCNSTTGLIGRLPFKTLGIGDLRDDSGECLWYSLSPVFRNTITTNARTNTPLAQALGAIDIKDKNGNVIKNNLIAVIFSPGASLPGQIRLNQGTSICGGNLEAKNYLETASDIDNAGRFTFMTGVPNSNDKMAFITVRDLYRPLHQRIIAEALGTRSDTPTYGLYWYFKINNTYPWAADSSYHQQTSLFEGKLPYPDLNFTVSSISQWLTKNNWWSLIKYKLNTDKTNVIVSIEGGN